ncbi:MAG: phosphatase PAP2 family protein [Sphingomicrobium sp.]
MALAAVALTALWLGMMFGGTGPLDQRVYEALYAGGHPAWVIAAKGASLFGDPKVLVPATFAIAAWLWWRGHPRTAATFIAVTMIGRALNSLVKLDVARERPALETHLMVEHTNSFPSGHASGSMLFFLALALLLAHRGRWHRWWAAAAILLSFAVGISRVMLGVHWPSDVIGGWAFGALWVIFTLRMTEDLVARDGAIVRR